LGPAPRDHCDGCHIKGHRWKQCFKRPEGAVPEHVKKFQKGVGDGGKTKHPKAFHSTDHNTLAMVASGLGPPELLQEDAQALAAVGGEESGIWLLDSAASFNFTPFLSDLAGGIEEEGETPYVTVGSGQQMPVEGMGTTIVYGARGQRLSLSKVHYVEGFYQRLLSVPHLTECGAVVTFKGDRCSVVLGKALVMEGTRAREGSRLFKVKLGRGTRGSAKEPSSAAAYVTTLPLDLVHKRLNHVGVSTIMEMVKQGSVLGMQVQPVAKGGEKEACEACEEGKAQRLPFPRASTTPITKRLALVHADLWGPARMATLGRQAIYILSLLDHFSSHLWAFLLPNKAASTVLGVLKPWLALVERQAGVLLRTLRTDNGSEFKGEVQEWLLEKGIQHQLTAPYNPEQNGRVERWHGTMGKTLRTLLIASGLPTNLWG
ncbi:transposase, partial [bacterium]|nr:transposase [bacterium]